MPKKDFTQVAFAVVQQASGEAPKKTRKLVATKASGRLGGAARMSQLDEAERKALSAKGVAARKRAPATKTGAPKTAS
jgi:hypothetical protein